MALKRFLRSLRNGGGKLNPKVSDEVGKKFDDLNTV